MRRVELFRLFQFLEDELRSDILLQLLHLGVLSQRDSVFAAVPGISLSSAAVGVRTYQPRPQPTLRWR